MATRVLWNQQWERCRQSEGRLLGTLRLSFTSYPKQFVETLQGSMFSCPNFFAGVRLSQNLFTAGMTTFYIPYNNQPAKVFVII